jgi:hypothetical protein
MQIFGVHEANYLRRFARVAARAWRVAPMVGADEFDPYQD